MRFSADEYWANPPDYPGPPASCCNYFGVQLHGGGYWLTTHELFADEPLWCGRLCRHCGEVRRVAYDDLGEIDVSTVLIDSRHMLPILDDPYETLVRGWGPYGEWGTNWVTREEALRGHWRIVERLRTGQHPDESVLYAAAGYEVH